MRKLLFSILLLMLVSVTPLWAQDEDEAPVATFTQYDCLYVMLHDGTQFSVPIDTASEVRSYTDEMGVRRVDVYGRTDSYSFMRQELRKLTFVSSPGSESIRQISADDTHAIMIRRQGDWLLFSSTLRGREAQICDISGQLIARFVIDETARYDTRILQRGIYLVNVDCYTYKLMTR